METPYTSMPFFWQSWKGKCSEDKDLLSLRKFNMGMNWLLEKQLQQFQNKPTASRLIPGADNSHGCTCSALVVKGTSSLTQDTSLSFRVLPDAAPAALTMSIPMGLADLLN